MAALVGGVAAVVKKPETHRKASEQRTDQAVGRPPPTAAVALLLL